MSENLPSKALGGDVKKDTQKQTRRVLILSLAALMIISCGLTSNRAQPVPTETMVVVPSKTPTLPPTPTPTPVPPALTVNGVVACFSGPGDAYELVVDLQDGEKAEITGQSEGFWVVRTSASLECWVPDQSVTTEGEVAGVPNIEPPPVPTPAAPVAPVNLQSIDAACTVNKPPNQPTSYTNQFHLAWQDMSNNEDGFRIYRDGNLVAEVPANKTDVIDELTARNNRAHYYYVVAYNVVGESKSEPIALSCEGDGGGGGGPGFGGGGFGP